MPKQAELTGWTAESWAQLSEIWRDLLGEDGVEYRAPVFREAEITAQQAGYVFQTWITEALRLKRRGGRTPFSDSGES